MAVYKVAQDVEADDKLIGPFSFRQFIYLIIVAMSGAIGWGLWNLLPPLAVVALPPMVFFGTLALPLRKDQPMEVYMAALVSYHLKPKRRLWVPDGIDSLIEITAPKVVEVERTKSLGIGEAERRLSYLADIVDTQGWAIRHTAMPGENSSMQSDVYYAAQQAEDMLDEHAMRSQSLDTMIAEADQRRRSAMIEAVRSGSEPAGSQPTVAIATPATPAAPNLEPQPHLDYNPYPTIHQSVIQPLDSREQIHSARPEPAPSTSATPVSPGIMNLVNNSHGLSVETLQREGNRIHEREAKQADKDDGEVVISLR